MRAQFVVRLLGEEDELLAWARVEAEARPQDRAGSCPFWPVTATKFGIERDGMAVKLVVHWADLDVARQTALPGARVSVGQVFDFTWIEPVWLVPGTRGVPLPSVTERAPVVVGVPTARLGVRP